MRFAALFFCAIVACSTNGSAGTATSDTAVARAEVVKLEAEARALAKTDGCTTSSQCRMAPVGNKACGGPRFYIPYCAASTDSAALFKKLDEVKAADGRLNKLTNAMSTCEMRMPPAPSFVGGHCGP